MGALEQVQKRLQDTNALIVQVQNAISLPENKAHSRSLEANLRALHNMRERLEAEFLEIAAREEQEVYRYAIDTVERPSLGGIAEAWAAFQKLFATVFSKLTKEELPAPLGYGYCFTGSVGVVVTLPKLPEQRTALLTANPIDDVSEIVFDLIESKRIPEIARLLGPGPMEAMNEWLGVHVCHKFGIRLEWDSARKTKRKVSASIEGLTRLKNAVEETTTEDVLIKLGELVAADIEAKTFRVNCDDGEKIAGKFTDAITSEHAASLPCRYRATIIKKTKMIVAGREKPESFFLSKLEGISEGSKTVQ